MYLISLIMPVYNGETYIRRALDSIISQKKESIELIIVNDGSTDNTENILKEYTNIKVVETENYGVSHARNIGINLAKGKYLMFIDADDQLAKNSIKYILESISKFNPDFLYFKRIDVHTEKKLNQKNGDVFIYNKGGKKYKEEFLSTSKHTFSVCNKVYKKDIVNENKLFFNEELKLSEDVLFNLQYLLYCSEIIIFDTRAVYYRYWNKNSTIHKPIKSYFSKNIIFIEKYKEFLAQKEIEEKEYKNIIGNLYYTTAKASLYRLYNDIDYSTAKERIEEINIIIKLKEVSYSTGNMKKYLELPSEKLVNKLIKFGNAHILYLSLQSIRKAKILLNLFKVEKR